MSDRKLDLVAEDGRTFRCRADDTDGARRQIRGRFGRVFRVRVAADGAAGRTAGAVYCADRAVRQLTASCRILEQLSHDNIVRLIAIARDAEAPGSLCILLEWLSGGSLRQFIDQRNAGLPDRCVSAYGRQIGSALRYLHSLAPPILHRNVKCRSVLLTESGCVKLAGFTACCREGNDPTEAEGGRIVDRRPPELSPSAAVACGAGGFSTKSDVWQFGCFVVEMAAARVEGASSGDAKVPDWLSRRLRDLCHLCTARYPTDRPSMAELMRHEFFE